MNRRKIITTAAAVAALLALGGCTDGTVQDPTPGIRAVTVPLEDGRTVQCVTRASGGIHCDWDNAK